jgi:hypothetical protein
LGVFQMGKQLHHQWAIKIIVLGVHFLWLDTHPPQKQLLLTLFLFQLTSV